MLIKPNVHRFGDWDDQKKTMIYNKTIICLLYIYFMIIIKKVIMKFVEMVGVHGWAGGVLSGLKHGVGKEPGEFIL